MDTFLKKTKAAFTDPQIRTRILYMLGGLLLFRLLAAIPAPGIDPINLQQFFADNQFFGLLNVFSGGGLSGGGISGISVAMLGVGPYITAAIIMQLLTAIFPKLKSLYHEEGQAGKRKFTQYSRLLTVPLGAIQAFGFLTLLSRQGVIVGLTPFDMVTNVLVITAASVLIMWIGELITEYGIGNGISLLITAGILAFLPGAVSQIAFTFTATQLPLYLGFLAAAVFVVLGIVVVNEAERPIPITYAKQNRGGRSRGGVSSYLPLKVNQAGVMPIIFALSILLFPQMIVNFVAGPGAAGGAGGVIGFIQMIFQNTVLYGAFYFLLVFVFTFFYTAITFDPASVAENLQKSGGFIPGVRPGQSTQDYIGTLMSRITFIGAVFLGLIAILPLLMQALTGNPALTIGGTALLIVVAVLVDLIKRIDGQVAMREY